MSRKKLFVITSLKFNIGHISHMTALYKAIEKLGFNVKLLLDGRYLNYIDKNEFKVEMHDDNYIVNQSATYIIQNPSKINNNFLKILKKSNTKSIYILHEPWTGIKDRLKTKNLFGIIRSILVNIYHNRTIKLSSRILVPSEFALKKYTLYSSRLNKDVKKLYLLFDPDEFSGEHSKVFMSYIGGIGPDHNFNGFVKFMNKFFDKSNMHFMIATRSDFKLDIINEHILKSKRFKLIKGRVMTNNEINQCYSESFCTWLNYNRSTQSGVLAKSFMFNTPILCSNLESFQEFIFDDSAIVFSSFEDEKLLDALKLLPKYLQEGVFNPKKYFDQYFNYKTNLNNILDAIIFDDGDKK